MDCLDRNGKLITRRIQRVFMNFSLVKNTFEPECDSKYLVYIKKARDPNPIYIMVLYDGKQDHLRQISEVMIVLLLI